MGPWTLRLACLLTAAALIAGCGGASQTTSSAPAAAQHATKKRAHRHRKAHTTRANRGSSTPRAYSASLQRSFTQVCAQSVRHEAAHIAQQYQPLVATGVDEYCSCALARLEGTVGEHQFKHDMLAVVYGRRVPSYMLVAEQACSAQLQATLSSLASS